MTEFFSEEIRITIQIILIDLVLSADNASLAAIVRDGQVIACSAHDVFAAGDELLFVASATAEAQIKACFIQS